MENYNTNKILEIINSIKDTKNFRIAFTHKSARFLDSNNELQSYERLEFFGDSLLEYYTTYFLFKSFPKHSEGDLTKLRTLLVERKNLSKITKDIGLDKYLKINIKPEPESDKAIKIQADIFESFIGALYIEKGENIVHEFLSLTLFNRPETTKYLKDYKLNCLFVNGAINTLANTDSNYNENNALTNANYNSNESRINRLTFKFVPNNKETIDNLIEQLKVLNKISNTIENSFENSIKQIIVGISLQNDLTRDIYVGFSKLKTILDQNKLDIHTELKYTNKFLYELNNSVLNITQELSELRLGVHRSTIIIILTLILIFCVLAIIAIKLIFNF